MRISRHWGGTRVRQRLLRKPSCLAAMGAVSVWLAAAGGLVHAQTAPAETASDLNPLAIVPIEASNRDQAKVVGSLQVTKGTTFILKNGTVTTGGQTTNVILPRRGVMHICPSTAVTLSADASVPAGETPGLMMAMDHGAVETSFAAGRNSDVLITPDFRILIAGPGAVEVKVRLGEHGDTCIDNPGERAPYVLVSSVFDGGAYRVQPGQRVMFQNGKLNEVVDNEKEPCGCPASARPGTNDFPADESAGLVPLQIGHPPAPPATTQNRTTTPQQVTTALTYPPQDAAASDQAIATPPAEAARKETQSPKSTAPAAQEPTRKKKGFFQRMGGFFRRIFSGD